MMSLSNFQELDVFYSDMPEADSAAIAAAEAHQSQLTKPPGALGKLEDLALFMAGWQQTAHPKIDKAQALIFAGNHGVCAQGVNPFPQDVTTQMVANFKAGGAAMNQLCAVSGAELSVIALDLETPTGDFSKGPALDETALFAAMQQGAAAIDTSSDIILLGEMGIGNSTVSAALAASLFGGDVMGWVGAGTGSDDAGMKHKAAIIETAIALHGMQDGLSALLAFGGREQAAICGAILAARAAHIPVMLDGFICTAAAAPLYKQYPKALDHCLVAHMSVEPGHKKLLAEMQKEALLDLQMRLGEGTGAALALSILKGAIACHNDMATFSSAGIAGA